MFTKLKKPLLGLSLGLVLGSMLFYISRSFYDYCQYEKELRQNVVYWKSVAGKHPSYPDSWVKLALNWYKLGEEKFAELAIRKASKLDPINDEIKNIKINLISN